MSVTVSFYLEQAVPPSETFGGWFAWRSIDSPREEMGWGETKESAIANLLAKTVPELQPISVADHLPADGDLVLFWVFDPTGPWRPFWRSGSFVNKPGSEQYFIERSTGKYRFLDEVNHWMPAPPAPVSKKDTSHV